MSKRGFTSLVEMFQDRVEEFGERTVFSYLENGDTESDTLTYSELERRSRRIAALLQEKGVREGRVLLLYPPGLEFITAFLGCLQAGAVAVPMFPPSPAQMARALPRLKVILEDAQARVALAPSFIVEMIESLAGELSGVQELRWLATDTLEAGLEQAWRPPALEDSSLAFLQYTSGSTADPKAVMLSHGNVLANLEAIQWGFGTSADSRGLSWLPLYHDMGLIGVVLGTLHCGGTSTLMSPLDFLRHPMKWLRAISRTRASISGAPNFAYELCVRKSTPEERAALDLSCWEVAFSGAERIRASTLELFTEAFAPSGFRPEAFYPCYGLAEATLMVSGSRRLQPPIIRHLRASALEQGKVVSVEAGAEDARPLVGCGRAPPGTEIVIVDPDSLRRCEEGTVGEAWVRAPSVARGYWNREAQTRQAFEARLAEEEGSGPFLRTGDLGFLKEGEFFVTGRLKDMVIIRGRNHYPEDLELTVERCHPAIRPGGCAAFAVEAGGEEQMVILAELDRRFASESSEADRRQVRLGIQEALAEQHQSRAHEIILVASGSIPKTSSGKVQRHACRRLYLERALEPISGPV